MSDHEHIRQPTGTMAEHVPERRKTELRTCVLIDDVNRRLDEGDARMGRFEAKIDANSVDTAEVLDILRLGKSFFRVVDGVARVIKWTLALAVPIAVLWYTIKNGGKS